jgi:hypothetical protein
VSGGLSLRPLPLFDRQRTLLFRHCQLRAVLATPEAFDGHSVPFSVMPLNFTEHEKPREPVEFFITNTKARPMDLEGEVVPLLIHKVGAWRM